MFKADVYVSLRISAHSRRNMSQQKHVLRWRM